MPVSSINNNLDLVVSNSGNNHDKELQDLLPGEVKVFDAFGGAIITSNLHQAGAFKIAGGLSNGVEPNISPIVRTSEIKKVTKKSYAALQEQIDYVGFNGTNGSIEEMEDNLYYLRLHIIELLSGSTDGRMIKQGIYQTVNPSPTQKEIATGLTNSLIANFSREATRLIKFERVNNGANVANTGTGALTVTEGSTRISAATDIDAVASVGDLIRFGTAQTSPVYEIVAMDTANETATLDLPYQGVTGTVATTAYRFITTIGADWGVKLSGLSTDYRRGRLRFTLSRFDMQPNGFGNTLITHAQKPSEGSGDGRAVADIEYFTQGVAGDGMEVSESPVLFDKGYVVDPTVGYDLYYISFHNEDNLGIANNTPSRKELMVAIKDDPASGVLETLLNTLSNNF